MKTIYFAGGCFWGVQRLFSRIDGVVGTETGYANGRADVKPDYAMVKKGDTGYRETVKVVFDEGKVALNSLLFAFFSVIDVTQSDGQAHDIGSQYLTGVFYVDQEDYDAIKEYFDCEKSKYPRFFTSLEKLESFFPAEEYHQDYLVKNPTGYCHIDLPKMNQILQKINNK